MTDRVWVEIPTVESEAPDSPVRPKYPIQGKAFLVHKGGKIYVVFQDDLACQEMVKQAGCRRLTPSEAYAFEESLLFPLPSLLFPDNYTNKNRSVGLGDVVAWLTRRAGVAECRACQQRKRWLNGITVWGWWRSFSFLNNRRIRV